MSMTSTTQPKVTGTKLAKRLCFSDRVLAWDSDTQAKEDRTVREVRPCPHPSGEFVTVLFMDNGIERVHRNAVIEVIR